MTPNIGLDFVTLLSSKLVLLLVLSVQDKVNLHLVIACHLIRSLKLSLTKYMELLIEKGNQQGQPI